MAGNSKIATSSTQAVISYHPMTMSSSSSSSFDLDLNHMHKTVAVADLEQGRKKYW